MAQTSYSLDHTASSAGQLGDTQSPISNTKLNVETAAGAGMGIAVSYGTAADGCVIGGTDYAGITFRLSQAGSGTANTPLYAQTALAEVMEIGRVWCPVSGAVSAGDAVAYINASGILTAGPATAGETNIVGARFTTAAADGENAKVRLVQMSTTAGS